MTDFKQIIKKLRNDRGLTLNEIAEWVGVSARSISNYEDGSSIPHKKTANKLTELASRKKSRREIGC